MGMASGWLSTESGFGDSGSNLTNSTLDIKEKTLALQDTTQEKSSHFFEELQVEVMKNPLAANSTTLDDRQMEFVSIKDLLRNHGDDIDDRMVAGILDKFAQISNLTILPAYCIVLHKKGAWDVLHPQLQIYIRNGLTTLAEFKYPEIAQEHFLGKYILLG